MSVAANNANISSRRAASRFRDQRCVTSHAWTGKLSMWILAMTLVSLGCGSATAPATNQRRLYVLADVNGQAVPAMLSSQAGDTSTILWATVTLDATGNAVLTQRDRDVYLNYPPDTSTRAAEMKYQATGDSITIGAFAPCRDACVPNLVGQLTDSVLTVTYDVIPRFDPVYRYRLSATY